MYGIIYKVTGPDGRVYVGQTTLTLSQRKSHHAYSVKKGDKRTPFHLALLAVGVNAFQWDRIDTADSKEELNQKEKQYIALYQSDKPSHGYNGTDGGEKTVYTEATRQKISKALKGKKLSPEHCHKLCEAWKHRKNRTPNLGKHPSSETRRKISTALTGIKRGPMSEETRRKLSKINKCKKLTPDHCRKVSEALKKFYKSKKGEESRRKQGAKRKGRKLTPEHRKAISEGVKRHNRKKHGARLALGI